LSESGLTLGDLVQIEDIFVSLIQASVHPRINYDEAIARARMTQSMVALRVERVSDANYLTTDEMAWLPPSITGGSDRALGLPDTNTPPDDDEDYDDDRTRAWD